MRVPNVSCTLGARPSVLDPLPQSRQSAKLFPSRQNWRVRGWESPDSDEGANTARYSLYIRTLSPLLTNTEGLHLLTGLRRVVGS